MYLEDVCARGFSSRLLIRTRVRNLSLQILDEQSIKSTLEHKAPPKSQPSLNRLEFDSRKIKLVERKKNSTSKRRNRMPKQDQISLEEYLQNFLKGEMKYPENIEKKLLWIEQENIPVNKKLA